MSTNSLTSTGTGRGPGTFTVSKSNTLIHARYRMTVAEQRVLLLCLSKIPYKLSREEMAKEYFYVTSQEYAAYCGVSNSCAYKEMRAAEERLWQRDWFQSEVNTKHRWVNSVRYARGSLGLRFSEAVVPFLVELSGSYTQYSLVAAMRLTSSVGHRLYEILIATHFHQRYEATITLDSLRFGMDLVGQYPIYAELRRRVIDPAVKDVSANSDIRIVNVIPRKQDRKVVALTFQYTANPDFDIDQIARDVSKGMGLVDENADATAHRNNVVSINKSKAPTKNSRKPSGVIKLTREFVIHNSRPGESWEEAERRLIAEQRKNGDSKTMEMDL